MIARWSAWRRRLQSPALAGTLAVLALLPQVSLARAILLGVTTGTAAALPIATTVLTGWLVGAVPRVAAAGLASPAGQVAVRWLLLAAALVLLGRVLGPLQAALATTFGRQVDRQLQERLMAAVSGPSGLRHLEDPATLDLIRNAQGVGAEGLHPGDAVPALASLIPSWLQALGSAAILLTFRPGLGLLWLALWPAMLAVLQREYVRVGQAAYGQADHVRRADYLRDLALTPDAAKEIRLWGMGQWLRDRFADAWLAAMQPVWKTRRPGRPILLGAVGLLALANLGSLVLLAQAAIVGNLDLAALAIYTRAILDASAFRAFDDANAHLARAAVSVPSLNALERRLAPPGKLETRPGDGLSSRSHRAGFSRILPVPGGDELAPDAPRREIRFERVSFRYPGQGVDVLDRLDLVLPAGRSFAIVGANGAGKTTLIKLLGRLDDPTGGRITVDGVDLRTVAPYRWQRRVAAIFQDFARYHLTARDNVALGAPALAGDAEKLRRAAEQAGALDLIESLPYGWDTVLSRQYTGGVDLSGGQWQRIALARALFAVAGGARVLILDEPTASLDVRAEAALYDRFLEITAGLTTILISHRFSTVRRADRIGVLAGGRLVEAGTHADLVAAGGHYATMFGLQAARFAEPSPSYPA